MSVALEFRNCVRRSIRNAAHPVVFGCNKKDVNTKFFVPRGGCLGGANVTCVAFSMRFRSITNGGHCIANNIVSDGRVSHAYR